MFKQLFNVLLVISIAPYAWSTIKDVWQDTMEPKNQIGVIKVQDCIYKSRCYIKPLEKFFKDPEIKAIVLEIESPGGAAGAAEALVMTITELKKKYPKPIIAYSESLCASAAYYIAAATDYIVTTPSCIVGSVGAALGTQFKVKKVLDKYDIDTVSVSAGDYKNILNPFTENTPEQVALLQDVTNDCYKMFASEVSKLRHLSLHNKDQWANGKIFTGQQALSLKLIDALGCLNTVRDYIQQNILHPDREIKWVYAHKPNQLQQMLSSNDEVECSLGSWLMERCLHAFRMNV